MLLGLSIRDVVLIDRLDIVFQSGLSVLTGETGAGKSILLDSLGLALGARSESGLLRPGAGQLSVAAEFTVPAAHAVFSLLAEQGLEAGDSVVLRRTVAADGRSRAFVNDQPVSVGLLRRLGDALVEIHGQFESHGLLDSTTHRGVLDAFGGLDVASVGLAWAAWQSATANRKAAEKALTKARADEDFLRHTVDELNALDPRPDEENSLAARRATLMHREKLMEGMNAALQALSQKGDVEASLRAAQRALEKMSSKLDGQFDPVIAGLDRAAAEVAEARSVLERQFAALDLDSTALEKAEERLFALRAAARKHGVRVSDLPDLRARIIGELEAVDLGGAKVGRLAEIEATAKAAYAGSAGALSQARSAASMRLDRAVAAELAPLKLDKATFRTKLERLAETEWGADGIDRVGFEVATNPGLPPGPLAKIASGGELARFMLALKVVLARSSPVPTMVFDEVDSGVGGAVAAAVGERLARLAADVQVLVVTHSPQVAAKGMHHWLVTKEVGGGDGTIARVAALAPSERREEIARMLAGARITDQARAAADSLLSAASA
jgi:DNA repair protein RecN (Recombination protein N)